MNKKVFSRIIFLDGSGSLPWRWEEIEQKWERAGDASSKIEVRRWFLGDKVGNQYRRSIEKGIVEEKGEWEARNCKQEKGIAQKMNTPNTPKLTYASLVKERKWNKLN